MEYQGHRFTFEAANRLDKGGMGEVYDGRRTDNSAVRVAIKVPFAQYAQDGGVVFLREAEAAQRVAGPHVVPVVDWGEQPPFIAFEFVEGPTLAKVLAERRSRGEFWSESELIDLFRQLTQAMKAINAQVVHRDLKPGNIFYDAGILRVTDFGLAKYVGEVTRANTVKGGGTTPYMAPEVFTYWHQLVAGKNYSIDWFSDQYSMGVIFYEMATLQRPFVGTDPELEHAHLYTTPRRITEIVSNLSDRLASLIARMLEKRTAKRFPSWDEITAELDVIESRLPQQPKDNATAGLSRKVAARLDAAQTKVLEKQRQEEEKIKKAGQRLSALNLWASEIFGYVRQRVRAINEDLGRQALYFEQTESNESPRRCVVSFPLEGLPPHSQTQLVIELATLIADPVQRNFINPQQAEPPKDVLLWGIVELVTPRYNEAFNVLLLEEPLPYGTWLAATIAPQPGSRMDQYRHEFEDERERGREYRIVPRNPYENVFLRTEIVLALNWQALIFWRPIPGELPRPIPGVRRGSYTKIILPYHEESLDFESKIDQLIDALIDKAGD